MPTYKLIPREILQEVENVLTRHAHQTVAVYAEAEKIRYRWKQKNIALEDIITLFVEGSGRHNVSVAFDPSEAVRAMMGDDYEGQLGKH